MERGDDMNNMYMALMKLGIKPEQAAKVLAQTIKCNERTARNKLRGTSDFTIREAVKINEKIFHNKYEIGYLFKREHENDDTIC